MFNTIVTLFNTLFFECDLLHLFWLYLHLSDLPALHVMNPFMCLRLWSYL